MSIPEHLSIVEFEETIFESHSITKIAMFNSSVTSDVEVEEYITSYMGIPYDPKIIIMTKEQYLNLLDRKDI